MAAETPDGTYSLRGPDIKVLGRIAALVSGGIME